MAEIERRFLIAAQAPAAARAERIEQGYLAIDRDGTEVRVRRRAGAHTLTVKSPDSGRVRLEEELEIDAERFERLWPLTEGRRLEKERHLIALAGGLTAELDVYAGRSPAFASSRSSSTPPPLPSCFTPPAWFGAEVTDDDRYRNRELAVHGAP